MSVSESTLTWQLSWNTHSLLTSFLPVLFWGSFSSFLPNACWRIELSPPCAPFCFPFLDAWSQVLQTTCSRLAGFTQNHFLYVLGTWMSQPPCMAVGSCDSGQNRGMSIKPTPIFHALFGLIYWLDAGALEVERTRGFSG